MEKLVKFCFWVVLKKQEERHPRRSVDTRVFYPEELNPRRSIAARVFYPEELNPRRSVENSN